MSDGPDFYDDDAVFAAYAAGRARPDNPNDTIERPALLELIGDMAGLRVLDLGCGDAAFGREALERGAAAYTGVEGSRNMVAAARSTLAGTSGTAVQSTIEGWSYPPDTFDLAVSRLALHYVADLAAVLAGVHRSLSAGGRLVCSVEHPVITSCARGWESGTLRQDWIVDDYFASGRRETNWMGGRVVKYHRTVEDYFGEMQRAGFTVEQLREARPRPERFADAATYARRMRIPLFLLLAGRRA